MLDSMRQASSGIMAKILLGLLVISFGLWGVASDFFGYGAGTVAQVGQAEVTAADYQRALNRRLNQLTQQLGTGVTLEQARAMGITSQILNELVSDAALTDQAREYNLGISDERLATAIAADPNFHDLSGRFDRARFQALLRNVGLNEDLYIDNLRDQIVRQQLANAIAGNISVPGQMIEAVYRFQNESRSVSFIELDASVIDPIADPGEDALQAYFAQNKAIYRAPEYRVFGYLAIDAGDLVDPAEVADPEVEALYQQRIDSYTVAERRRIDQIRFDTEEEARTAMAGVATDTDFEALIAARELTASDVDLGLKTKAEIVDANVADAAFAADSGAIVPVFDGTLGPAIIRVTEVQPGSVRPFSDVADALRADIAARRGADQINSIYDAIEDERAAGTTLEEIAEKMSLEYVKPAGIAEDSLYLDGTASTDLPGRFELIADIFQSDVGLENNPVRAGDTGWVFYEVLDIIPERDRTYDEVQAEVLLAWRNEETSVRIAERADALKVRLEAGAEMETLAAELGKTVQRADQLTRGGSVPELSRNALAQAFAGPTGHVANAEADTPPNRFLVQVDTIVPPAFFGESDEAKSIAAQLERSLQTDILTAYNGYLLATRDPYINSAIFSQLTGATPVPEAQHPRL